MMKHMPQATQNVNHYIQTNVNVVLTEKKKCGAFYSQQLKWYNL